MVSKLSVFLIAIIAVIGLDATCPTANQQDVTSQGSVATTTTFQTSTPTPVPAPTPIDLGSLWHVCPRSMNNWLRQTYQMVFKCSLGFRGNACTKVNVCAVGQACCQQPNGCNKCVDPCPNKLIPPSDCKTGYRGYNSPLGCAYFICNEVYDATKAADDAGVAAALVAQRDAGAIFGIYYEDY